MKFPKILTRHWQITIIIFWAIIVRFWRIHDLTTFAGDQGIDFLIVKRMIIDGKFTLLGPKLGYFSDVANIYLGPAYYYLISLPLLLTSLDPIGPIIFVGTLSLSTIILIYAIGVIFFNKTIAVIASLLFAFSVSIIEQSRVPLNPNLIPFFSALLILALFKIIYEKKNNIIWPLILGLTTGILFQLHYLTLSIIFVSFLALIFYKHFKKTIVALIAFFTAITPQLLFEIRHDFFISTSLVTRIFKGENVSSPLTFITNMHQSTTLLSSSIFIIDNLLVGIITVLLVAIGFLNSKANHRSKQVILLGIIIISLVFSSLTSFKLQLHYFAHTYVPLVVLLAATIYQIFRSTISSVIKFAVVVLLMVVVAINLSNLNLNRAEGYTMAKGWNLTGVKKTSQIISNDVKPLDKFNIAATLDGDTRARPYRYMVEVYGKTPLGVEDYPQSDILFLISRDSVEQINNSPVWEISSFKPFIFERNWSIQNGIKLYKLTKEKYK